MALPTFFLGFVTSNPLLVIVVNPLKDKMLMLLLHPDMINSASTVNNPIFFDHFIYPQNYHLLTL